MTNDQFLTECKFLANYVLKQNHEDLDKAIDNAVWTLKVKRTNQVKNGEGLKDELFEHWAKQYRPLVRWMVYACDSMEKPS